MAGCSLVPLGGHACSWPFGSCGSQAIEPGAERKFGDSWASVWILNVLNVLKCDKLKSIGEPETNMGFGDGSRRHILCRSWTFDQQQCDAWCFLLNRGDPTSYCSFFIEKETNGFGWLERYPNFKKPSFGDGPIPTGPQNREMNSNSPTILVLTTRFLNRIYFGPIPDLFFERLTCTGDYRSTRANFDFRMIWRLAPWRPQFYQKNLETLALRMSKAWSKHCRNSKFFKKRNWWFRALHFERDRLHGSNLSWDVSKLGFEVRLPIWPSQSLQLEPQYCRSAGFMAWLKMMGPANTMLCNIVDTIYFNGRIPTIAALWVWDSCWGEELSSETDRWHCWVGCGLISSFLGTTAQHDTESGGFPQVSTFSCQFESLSAGQDVGTSARRTKCQGSRHPSMFFWHKNMFGWRESWSFFLTKWSISIHFQSSELDEETNTSLVKPLYFIVKSLGFQSHFAWKLHVWTILNPRFVASRSRSMIFSEP